MKLPIPIRYCNNYLFFSMQRRPVILFLLVHSISGAAAIASSIERSTFHPRSQFASLSKVVRKRTGRNPKISLQAAIAGDVTDSGFDAGNSPLDENELGQMIEDSFINPLVGVNTTNSSKSKTQAEIANVKFNANDDGEALTSTLVFTVILTVSFLLISMCLRRWNAPVYTRWQQGHEDHGETLQLNLSVDWIRQVLDTSADREVEEAGLDGWSLIEFYRFNCRMLSVIGPPIMVVVGTAHYISTPSTLDFLSRFDIDNANGTPQIRWLHASCVWFVVVAVTSVMKSTHQDFMGRRFDWLKTMPSPQGTTIMVENIPPEFRSDQALRDYFQGPSGVFIRNSSVVQNSYIVRKTPHLRNLWEDLQDAKKALDLNTHRQEGAEEAPVDVVDELTETVSRLSEAVSIEREKIEEAVSAKNSKVCSSSGFVTFSSVVWQRLALKEHFRADRTVFVASMPPDPNDVAFENLADNSVASSTWYFVGCLCLLGIFIFWSPIVVFISTWTTLTSIRRYLPLADKALDSASDVLPSLPALLEGVLATGALRFFLAFLPSILFSIIRTFFPVKAGVMAQFRLFRWYFAFLLLFVLLVTTLGRGLVVTVVGVAKEPGEIIKLLATWLPRSSHFFFNYMIFGWATLFWESIRFAVLSRYWFYRYFYKSDVDQAKRLAEPEDEASFGMGSRMALASLMSAMTLVFCTCSPIIMVFSWIYFIIGRHVYAYLVVHVEHRKPDLGGVFWVEAVQQVFFVLLLYILLMTGVLCGQEQSYANGPAYLTFSAILVLYFMWSRLNSFEWETLPLEQMMNAVNEGVAGSGKTLGEYRQPECSAHA